jgi:hypothetical protein
MANLRHASRVILDAPRRRTLESFRVCTFLPRAIDPTPETLEFMKTLLSRSLAVSVLAVACWMLLMGATTKTATPILQPDKLIILSTTDVKGKTSPCG